MDIFKFDFTQVKSNLKFEKTNLKSWRHLPETGLSIVSEITFHFRERVFSSGKTPKQACSVLHNCFGNAAGSKKTPLKWKVISDTMLK